MTDEQIEEYGNIPDGFLLNPEEVEELRTNKRQLAAYAQQKLRKLMAQRTRSTNE